MFLVSCGEFSLVGGFRALGGAAEGAIGINRYRSAE